ncbi:NADH dehydrogenase [Devosia epidermidihirudinis]|uniref:NADH-quinone oxidoreductase subunit C n=1 Tax=Devosia epidermidihirudinis TaxID=1293439 RepID=A0A0F5QCI5_9HYPH|nr:NADH-quinone oxidoreductase subunit C [Devosia epidermidihirudinis]KKC38707.1 NADH dehydrogenase [Devosia epidermidihirudinis]
MDEAIQVDPLADLGEHIAGQLGSTLLAKAVAFGELTLVVERDSIVSVATFLRDDPRCRFISFVDVCGADYPERDERFEVVYHFMSPHLNQRIRVKVSADDMTPVPSITDVFVGAGWFERETYDLYGVLFSGHPDLRRILTDYGFDGHPLRKDFPTTGFVEVRYDEERKRVVYEPVRLAQEFRSFDYLSPWEGTDYVLPGDEKAKQ